MQQMVQGGATLHPEDHPTVVRGHFKEGMGGGKHSLPCKCMRKTAFRDLS